MSAETLREAAKVLRERANQAPRGPWRPLSAGAVGYPMTVSMQGTVAATYPTGGSDEQRAVTTYIAMMHPGVGLALAQWLENIAHNWDTQSSGLQADAADVARAVLGHGVPS